MNISFCFPTLPSSPTLNLCQVATELLPSFAWTFDATHICGTHHAEGQGRQKCANEFEDDVKETLGGKKCPTNRFSPYECSQKSRTLHGWCFWKKLTGHKKKHRTSTRGHLEHQGSVIQWVFGWTKWPISPFFKIFVKGISLWKCKIPDGPECLECLQKSTFLARPLRMPRAWNEVQKMYFRMPVAFYNTIIK